MPVPSRVLVALSGGPDSTALLLALRDLGRTVLAAHFDHRLRPGSAADADHVLRLCDRLGVLLVLGEREGPLAKGSVQAAARDARYRFLAQARERTGADVVALGHTADDVVEGACLHLLRGSGLAGMRGMPVRRDCFVRPLLEVWRVDVLDYLRSRGESWIEDPSNADLRYARARLRAVVLPRLEVDCPGLVARLRGAARAAARWQEALEHEADRLLGGNNAEIAVSALAGVSEGLRAEVLRQLYRRVGGPLPGLSRRQLAALSALVRPGPEAEVDLPAGIRCRRSAETIQMLAPGSGEVAKAPVRLLSRPCPGCSQAGAVHLRPGLPLELGCRSPGLRLRPLPGRGTRKLQDVLVDAKVPRHLRDHWPLVFAGGRLAWVPGICVDRDLVAPPGHASIHVTLEPWPPYLPRGAR